MAPADIRTTFFNGQPFTATSPSGTKFTMIFTPDGKMTREPIQQSGSKSAGTWKLSTHPVRTTGCWRLMSALSFAM